MKKLFALVLALIMFTAIAAGCTAPETPAEPNTPDVTEKEDVTVRVGALTGPTVIGLTKLMDDSDAGKAENDYEFTVAGSADEITPSVIQGTLDIALVPANLASVLYNKTNGGVKVVAINTLGVLYIVEKNETLTGIADLVGKTIYATGKGSSPEYALRYILSQNGIDPDKDVTIEFKSEPAEVVAVLKSSENAIAMLPQPYVTSAKANVEGLETAFDLTEEWDKLGTDSRLLTGVAVIRTEFSEKYPQTVANFLSEYGASIEYVKANAAEAAASLEARGIFKAAIIEKAIPYCNLVCLTGTEMKTALSGYLKTVYDQNANAVGGKLPDDEFYYEK